MQSNSRNFNVLFGRLIKCRSYYLCLYYFFHICNLFGTLIYQYNHEVTFRMIGCNSVSNIFQ